MKIFKWALIIFIVLAGILWFVKYKYSINPPVRIFAKKYEGGLPLDRLVLPEGFGIDVYAEGIKNARSLCYAPSGTLFVSTRSEGKVYALRDTDGDMRADKVYILLEGGNMPNGVAWKDGDLYVAEVNRILRFRDIDKKLENPGTPEVVYDKYPTEKHHGWKYIAFGPDGKLYVPVGAPCNICESENPVYNTITRLNDDGSGFEIVHSGIRNTVGFTWHPATGALWFTDNGRDMMGDDIPDCELNYAPKEEMHFGYPYCHAGDVPDPEFGSKRPCSDFTPPVLKLGPHTAPLGLEFYTGSNFPAAYKNGLLIARHGSWNRSRKIGYDVYFAQVKEDMSIGEHRPFITGWLNTSNDDVWGRPVDIEMLPDGSVLISDDYADAIYRVFYKSGE
jgi:glucose/arabinose dehydrogenase